MSHDMGYSDLEVRHSHERVNLMKEVVPQQNPPFPTQSEHQPIQMESEYPSLPTQNEYHRATLRICGLLPRTLWIVVGLVGLLLIGAIVGGVVGGLEAKKSKSSGIASNSSGNSGNGTSSNGSLAILLDSKLSAVNWTSSGGTERQAVFYQDGWNSLLVSFRNTQNATWTSVNISQKLASTGNPIKVKSGTPLAGTAVGSPFSFSVSLFYFNSSNSVSEVSSVDETLETWTIGDLSKQGNLQPSDSSQLAAIAHFCEYGCAQLTYVVYEDDSQNIWLANSSDWRANSTGSLLSHVDPSSGLTLIPFAADNGDNITNAYELRLYYDASSQIEEYKFDIEMSWSSGQQLVSGMSITPNSARLAASYFVDGSSGKILVVALEGNGTLTGFFYDPATYWQDKAHITFIGGSSQVFLTVTMNDDLRFFGLANGTISEYQWTLDDPLDFNYVGEVLAPLPV